MRTDPDGNDVVQVHGLIKSYGRSRALDGLDLTIRAGEVHGFLGPNGSGKSTTLRALLGLLRVDGGAASVFGLDPWRDAVAIHRRLAYVPGDVALWPNLTGGETVDLLLRMRGVDPTTSRKDELVDRFRLDPTKKGRAYSKGNRQKVALVAAFSVDTELLILDEPTSGLDPLMEQVFNECVAEHTARGVTVLLSSHILGEVEHLAQRVTIIREGRTIASGSLAELTSSPPQPGARRRHRPSTGPDRHPWRPRPRRRCWHHQLHGRSAGPRPER
ncbi:ABC transporter ATP-binding protein [Aeromicrobium sp. UC242_57]|uniref:ABC transporter ATP-binding protein n=1 Tax=Aeromicrobium sp. UC242_57 TaxID=3374624 RepID=UPI00379EB4F5